MAPARLRGRAEAIAFYTGNVWKAFSDLAVELSDGPFFDPHAPRIAIEWHGTGTHTGLLDPRGLAPTGKSFELRAWEMIEFCDGQARRLVQVFNAAALMHQLGLLPAALA